jgi:Protein of unknown function (DUF2726)
MNSTYVSIATLFIVLTIVGVLSSKWSSSDKVKSLYFYRKKLAIMTDHELRYYKILNEAVGTDYYLLAQVHLSAFLDEKVKGQRWNAAFRHINSKSIDFLLCDKTTLAPLLAIELDDRTHEQPYRRLRDAEVERILSAAQLPLMRAKSHGTVKLSALQEQIKILIGQRTIL